MKLGTRAGSQATVFRLLNYPANHGPIQANYQRKMAAVDC